MLIRLKLLVNSLPPRVPKWSRIHCWGGPGMILALSIIIQRGLDSIHHKSKFCCHLATAVKRGGKVSMVIRPLGRTASFLCSRIVIYLQCSQTKFPHGRKIMPGRHCLRCALTSPHCSERWKCNLNTCIIKATTGVKIPISTLHVDPHWNDAKKAKICNLWFLAN